MFESDTQLFMFYDKYARWNGNRRETWTETVTRTTDYLRELSQNKLPEHVYKTIHTYILEGKVTPSMRLLASAGPQARRNNISLYNCLSKDTRFVTSEGIKSFEDYSDGDEVTILTHRGRWMKARVSYYGKGNLRTIQFKRGKYVTTVKATNNHRWLLTNGTETTTLSDGDYVQPASNIFSSFVYEQAEPEERLYWCYGFVYGDGTKVKDQNGEYRYSMVRLCGNDVEYASRFAEMGFKTSSNHSLKGDVYAFTGTYLKTAPDPQLDPPNLIRAFVAGYLAADGHKSGNTNNSPFDGIQASDPSHIAFIRACFPIAGVFPTKETDLTGQVTNYGTRPFTIKFNLTSNFQNAHSNLQFIAHPTSETETGELWCLEVEEDRSFTLANGLVTGNCSFVGVDALESFAEALFISMSGCGVGFSVEKKYIDQLPGLPNELIETNKTFIVADSAEGWYDAVLFQLRSLFKGEIVKFDYSQIRPKGAILKTKGGRASGPEPLKKLLDFIEDTFIYRAVDDGVTDGQTVWYFHPKDRLTSLEVFDIMCHVGNCAVSGGSRRSAMLCLFDMDDELMKNAKTGDYPLVRSISNNSMVWPKEGIEFSSFLEWITHLFKYDNGEYSVWNPAPLQMVKDRRDISKVVGVNPCGEINLRHMQFCNLSSAICRHDDDLYSLAEKVKVAAVIGTIQALATEFPLLRSQWRENCEEERLLGVDLNGIMDCPLLIKDDGQTLSYLREVAQDTNMWAAKILGINPATAVTCVKPNGNSSELLNCSSGMKPREATYYRRRYRVTAHSPIYNVLFASGVPLMPENGQDWATMNTAVATFYARAPEESKLQSEFTAIQMCEFWLKLKLDWTDHNPSVTIRYKPEEKKELLDWLWEHREVIGGMTFLPVDQKAYEQPPYESISEEEYYRELDKFPQVKWELLEEFEREDMTTSAQEIACSSGTCDVF